MYYSLCIFLFMSHHQIINCHLSNWSEVDKHDMLEKYQVTVSFYKDSIKKKIIIVKITLCKSLLWKINRKGRLILYIFRLYSQIPFILCNRLAFFLISENLAIILISYKRVNLRGSTIYMYIYSVLDEWGLQKFYHSQDRSAESDIAGTNYQGQTL